MAAITWDARLATGVKGIDDQHKNLIAIVNRLHGVYATKAGPLVVPTIIGELRDYAKFHFAQEEEFMARHGFPALASHRMAHLNLTNQVKLYQQRLYQKDHVVPVELMAFLRVWLVDHIVKMDMGYVKFINSRPAQVSANAEGASRKPEEAQESQ